MDEAPGHDPVAHSAELEAEVARLRTQLAATQHRVRNTLAVIRSIARRSAEASESVEEYATHLDGRISAFARVQGALLRNPDEGMALEALVADTLLLALAREGNRWTLSGPKVTLRARTAELLGLALHELATNAVKFGALSWPKGRITVTWTLAAGDAPHLALSWVETGAPAPLTPARRGFGSELLERTLAYELDANVSLDFTSSGVVCGIELPMR